MFFRPVTKTPHQPGISHPTAVLIIASVATVWGFGFPMTRIVLDGGLSVGALMSIRFPLAGLLMFAIIRAKGIPITRRGMVDGTWLGLVLVVIFWLQSDGMRFTTTAKSGFITGLYVLFTPLVAFAIGQRVKLASALGAVIATYGMYLLVHLPGGWGAGWNRGDVEILLCALLCGVHMVMMGAFARRSEAWLLAGSQVVICGVVSVLVTAFLPSPYGFQTAFAALSHLAGSQRDPLPCPRLHGLRILGTSDRPDAARADRVGGAVQPGTGGRGLPQRVLAERVDDATAGVGRRAHRGGDDRLRGAAIYVPRHYGAGHKAVR